MTRTVRSSPALVALLDMSDQHTPACNLAEPTAEVVAHLLDMVATNNAHDGLSDLEQIIARLRQDAAQASDARDLLRTTSADVLREALRLRAARSGATRTEPSRTEPAPAESPATERIASETPASAAPASESDRGAAARGHAAALDAVP